MIPELIAAFVSVFIALSLFLLGQSKKTIAETIFYGVLLFGILAAVIGSVVVYFLTGNPLFLFGAVILFLERVAWMITLRETSGKDRLVWFLLVYYIPLFWLIYRVVDLK